MVEIFIYFHIVAGADRIKERGSAKVLKRDLAAHKTMISVGERAQWERSLSLNKYNVCDYVGAKRKENSL